MQGTKASEANIQLNCCMCQTFQSYLHQHYLQTSTSLHNCFGVPKGGLLLDTIFLFQIIGDFSYNATSGAIKPVGGITYLVTAPNNINQVALDPLRAAAYLGIIVAFCAVFSLIWLEVGGLGPAKVAKQLMDSGMQIPGYRRSGRPIEAVLKRYIPVVTVLGGIIVGLVVGLSDFLGAYGTGTGILLSVGIIYQYYELLMRERAAEMFPAFRQNHWRLG